MKGNLLSSVLWAPWQVLSPVLGPRDDHASQEPSASISTCETLSPLFLDCKILTFNFVLGYSRLTNNAVNTEGTQMYIYMYPFPSQTAAHPGCHLTPGRLSRWTTRVSKSYSEATSTEDAKSLPSEHPQDTEHRSFGVQETQQRRTQGNTAGPAQARPGWRSLPSPRTPLSLASQPEGEHSAASPVGSSYSTLTTPLISMSSRKGFFRGRGGERREDRVGGGCSG